jgi:hypothetical protein
MTYIYLRKVDYAFILFRNHRLESEDKNNKTEINQAEKEVLLASPKNTPLVVQKFVKVKVCVIMAKLSNKKTLFWCLC